ncbi:hypothetical protein JW877_09960 [bacterium]|nr:hypothetical protein [bacterium]
MDDNRRKVLELLSEGKVSVDEAERLLSALKGTPRKEQVRVITDNISKGVSRVLESVPHMVGSVATAFHGGTKETINMEGKSKLLLKCVGVDAEISPSDNRLLYLESSTGVVKINQEDDSVQVKSIGTTIELKIPLIDECELKLMGGMLEGTIPARTMIISCKGGEVDLGLPDSESINIYGFGGNLALAIPPDGDFNIEAEFPGGNFSTDLPVKIQEETDCSYKGTLNEGGNHIIVNCRGANVKITALKPQKEEE